MAYFTIQVNVFTGLEDEWGPVVEAWAKISLGHITTDEAYARFEVFKEAFAATNYEKFELVMEASDTSTSLAARHVHTPRNVA